MGKKKEIEASISLSGVPNSLTIADVISWVKPRVTEKRFKHIEGVVRVAVKLCQKTDVDPVAAQLAGWIHDSCKEIKDRELIAMAKERSMPLHPMEERYGHILHGPVAALVAKEELGISNKAILDSISEHTLGNVPMTLLSKIIFLADCLEESRPKSYTDPIWKAMGSKDRLDFDRAILIALELNLLYLIEDERPIHPKTVDVRNHYLELVRIAENSVS